MGRTKKFQLINITLSETIAVRHSQHFITKKFQPDEVFKNGRIKLQVLSLQVNDFKIKHYKSPSAVSYLFVSAR